MMESNQHKHSRRHFVKQMAVGMGVVGLGGLPWRAFSDNSVHISILHTNDVHSRIEPFPDNAGRLAGRGGASRRSAYIKNVRESEANVLLLDAGDIWQGTPYFNEFKGSLEFELMSRMNYDASTLGNHDFDLGLEGLVAQWDKAEFPFICSNYDFTDTPLNGKTEPFKVFEFENVKIGVIGLGVELKGLVPDPLFGNTIYLDPVKAANTWSRKLKKEMDCDFVVALSHLGLSYEGTDKISDESLVPQTKYIDLVIGGHTHTFLEKPKVVKNENASPVAINQVGYGGAMIGRIDLSFDKDSKKRMTSCQNCWL